MMSDQVFYRAVHKEHRVVERGEGIYLFDRSGRRYIDACAGSAVVNIGHGNPEVIAAMTSQAQKVSFTHLSRWTSEPLRQLADAVAEMAPAGLNRLYMVSGGSEATETALKMARQYYLERDGGSNKYKVISRWKTFHGNTIGALSMTGDKRRKKYAPLLLDFPKISPPYCYRCDYGLAPDSCGLECAWELERVVKMLGADNVAAFIAEPVIGAAAGAVAPPEGYFPVIREICDRHDLLFIADEVMTGFGRTGSVFAMEQFGAVPDMMAMAKGMSAGYVPIGGVIVREDIWEAFRRGSGVFVHGHTYGGNPLAAAVAVAVLKVVREQNLVENARVVGKYLLEQLRDQLSGVGIVGDVRGRGLLQGIELVRNQADQAPFAPEMNMAEKATVSLMDCGVVVYPGTGAADGIAGDHLLIAPPLIITRDQVDDMVTRIAAALTSLEKSLA